MPDPVMKRLLHHEQGHFNIAEVAARRLNVSDQIKVVKAEYVGRGATPQAADADLGMKLEVLFKRLNAEDVLKVQQRYDEETAHSTDLKAQKRWDALIQKELATYRPYW
jgi:hypothetical protein